MPFATTLIGRNDGWIATTVYAGTVVVAATRLALMWFYATAHGLIEPLEAGNAWVRALPWLQVVSVFALSALIAPIRPDLGRWCWLLLFVPLPRAAR